MAWRSILIVLVAGGLPRAATAQDPLEFERPEQDEWRLTLTPYAWFAAQASDVGGEKLRQSFSDLASITNVGFQIRSTARLRQLLVHADWTYADLASTTSIGQTKIDLGVKQHILDLRAGRTVFDSRTIEQDGGLAVGVSGGARLWVNDIDYTISRVPIIPGDTTVVSDSDKQNWWDPMVGVFLHFPVTTVVGFHVRASGGGLGIGAASDYVWDAEFLASFRLGRRFLVLAGYRTFKYSRTDGEGADELNQTVSVTGPLLGLTAGIF